MTKDLDGFPSRLSADLLGGTLSSILVMLPLRRLGQARPR
jgi:hypothetical protein